MVNSAEPGLSTLRHQEGRPKGDGNATFSEYLETTRTLGGSLSPSSVHLPPASRSVPASACVLSLHCNVKLSSALLIFLREALDLGNTLQLSFDTAFPEGVNTQHQKREQLILQSNKRGKCLLLTLAGGSQCHSASCLQSCLGNGEGNYSSCSETSNIDLVCRFSFMLGGKHQGLV